MGCCGVWMASAAILGSGALVAHRVGDRERECENGAGVGVGCSFSHFGRPRTVRRDPSQWPKLLILLSNLATIGQAPNGAWPSKEENENQCGLYRSRTARAYLFARPHGWGRTSSKS